MYKGITNKKNKFKFDRKNNILLYKFLIKYLPNKQQKKKKKKIK